MPDRQTIADVEARLERHAQLFETAEPRSQHIDDLTALLASHRKMREALEYIGKNDIAYLVAPTPGAKGYPGHYGHTARQALQGDAVQGIRVAGEIRRRGHLPAAHVELPVPDQRRRQRNRVIPGAPVVEHTQRRTRERRVQVPAVVHTAGPVRVTEPTVPLAISHPGVLLPGRPTVHMDTARRSLLTLISSCRRQGSPRSWRTSITGSWHDYSEG